jgi:hypothetical protein
MVTKAAVAAMALAVWAVAAGCKAGSKPPPWAETRPMAAAKDSSPKPSVQGTPYDKPGFATRIQEGRLWVFKQGTKELAEFDKQGELAKHVIRPGAGPKGMTIKAPDAETILAYLAFKPGFAIRVQDGRIWVFKHGAKELEDYDKQGELAKHVIRPGAGPKGMTIKAPDFETIDAYLAVK